MRILALLAVVILSAGCTSGLASAHIEVSGGHLDIDMQQAFDIDSRPTEHLYTQHEREHPDFYSAHDLLFEWSTQNGRTLEVEWFDSSFGYGYSICSIDDFPPRNFEGQERGCFDRGGFWALELNGEPAEVGMSDLEIGPGDELFLNWTTL